VQGGFGDRQSPLNHAQVFPARRGSRQVPMTSGEHVLFGLKPNVSEMKYKMAQQKQGENLTIKLGDDSMAIFDKKQVYKLLI